MPRGEGKRRKSVGGRQELLADETQMTWRWEEKKEEVLPHCGSTSAMHPRRRKLLLGFALLGRIVLVAVDVPGRAILLAVDLAAFGLSQFAPIG
jgi:hypothetical protein